MKTTDLMGKLVVVEQVFKRKHERVEVAGRFRKTTRERRFWQPETAHEVRTGWVVGIRHLQQGVYEPGGGSYDDYEPAYLKQDGPAIPALMVAYWPTMKPVPVPMDGYRLATDEDERPKSSFYPWSDANRDWLRKEMQSMPRDEKGRWLKASSKVEVQA